MPKNEDVYTALFEFQKEMGVVMKDAENPFHKSKYATLKAVWAAVHPLLEKNNLIVYHQGFVDGAGGNGGVGIKGVLRHIPSGTEIESDMLMPLDKQNCQAVGSANTYGRRYTISGLLNLQVDEDDDGNAASGAERKAPAKKGKAKEQPQEDEDVPVDFMLVAAEFAKSIGTVDELKDYYKDNSKKLSKEDRERFKKILSARKREIERG